MFFLLKCAFWLGLVFLVLPSPEDARGRVPAQIAHAAGEAAGDAGRDAAHRVKAACANAPRACLEAAARLAPARGSDTLNPSDRQPAWRRPGQS